MSPGRGLPLCGKLGFVGVVAMTLAMLAPGSAGASQNGDPCSPFFVEVTPPEAQFLTTVTSPRSVNFDASISNWGTAEVWTFVAADNACEATRVEPDPVVYYSWDFGDGGSTGPSSSPITSHTYSTGGTHIITLTVTERDCEGGTNAHCFTGATKLALTLADLPPVASFTAPASALTGGAVSFDASASADPDGTIVSYHWAFGDGETQDTASPTTTHSYRLNGPKTVTLTVTDDGGSTAQASRELSVSHVPPVASFTAPTSVTTGQLARFDASGSSDVDGTITSYRWDFGDGQTLVATTPVATHTFANGGTRAVTLTVVDNSAGTNVARRVVTVADRAPNAAFTGPATVAVGQPARFDASASSDPDGTITGYRWDFGDGTSQTTADPIASHAYGEGAAKTVTLTITDDNDNAAQTQHAITVVARQCVVPRLVGNKLGQARNRLRSRNCRLGAVRHKHAGTRKKGRVTGQSTKPGAIRPQGAAVAVTVGN